MTLKGSLVNLLIFAVFVSLALVATYPLVSEMTHLVFNPDGHFDSVIFFWDFWWTKVALFDLGQQPFYTQHIFYPEGTSLAFHPFPLTYNLLSLPIQFLYEDERGQILAYNLFILLSYGLTGLGTFLLTDRLVGNKKAAFISALFFTFSPYRFWNLERLHVFCTELLPFCILSIMKMLDEQKRRHSIFAGVLLSITFYTSLTHLTSLAIFSVLLVSHRLWKQGRSFINKPLLWRIGLAAAIFLLASSPFIRQIFVDYKANPNLEMPFLDTVNYSTDPTRVIAADGSHPLYAKLLGLSPRARTMRLLIDGESFAGLTIVVLMLIACIHKPLRKRGGFWIFCAFVFLIFSMGPYLRIGDNVYRNVPLPYLALYSWVPIFRISRWPSRHMAMFLLSSAVLSAFTLALFMEARRSKTFTQYVIPLVVALAIVAENWVGPVIYDEGRVPGIYRTIARDEEDYVVVDLPFSQYWIVRTMYYQTVHGKRSLVAKVGRPTHTSSYVEASPLLKWFSLLCPPEYYTAHFVGERRRTTVAMDRAYLARNKVKYLILHTDWTKERTVALWDALIREYEPESISTDLENKLIVYRLF